MACEGSQTAKLLREQNHRVASFTNSVVDQQKAPGLRKRFDTFNSIGERFQSKVSKEFAADAAEIHDKAWLVLKKNKTIASNIQSKITTQTAHQSRAFNFPYDTRAAAQQSPDWTEAAPTHKVINLEAPTAPSFALMSSSLMQSSLNIQSIRESPTIEPLSRTHPNLYPTTSSPSNNRQPISSQCMQCVPLQSLQTSASPHRFATPAVHSHRYLTPASQLAPNRHVARSMTVKAGRQSSFCQPGSFTASRTPTFHGSAKTLHVSTPVKRHPSCYDSGELSGGFQRDSEMPSSRFFWRSSLPVSEFTTKQNCGACNIVENGNVYDNVAEYSRYSTVTPVKSAVTFCNVPSRLNTVPPASCVQGSAFFGCSSHKNGKFKETCFVPCTEHAVLLPIKFNDLHEEAMISRSVPSIQGECIQGPPNFKFAYSFDGNSLTHSAHGLSTPEASSLTSNWNHSKVTSQKMFSDADASIARQAKIHSQSSPVDEAKIVVPKVTGSAPLVKSPVLLPLNTVLPLESEHLSHYSPLQSPTKAGVKPLQMQMESSDATAPVAACQAILNISRKEEVDAPFDPLLSSSKLHRSTNSLVCHSKSGRTGNVTPSLSSQSFESSIPVQSHTTCQPHRSESQHFVLDEILQGSQRNSLLHPEALSIAGRPNLLADFCCQSNQPGLYSKRSVKGRTYNETKLAAVRTSNELDSPKVNDASPKCSATHDMQHKGSLGGLRETHFARSTEGSFAGALDVLVTHCPSSMPVSPKLLSQNGCNDIVHAYAVSTRSPSKVARSRFIKRRSSMSSDAGFDEDSTRKEIRSVCPAIASSAGKEWRLTNVERLNDAKVSPRLIKEDKFAKSSRPEADFPDTKNSQVREPSGDSDLNCSSRGSSKLPPYPITPSLRYSPASPHRFYSVSLSDSLMVKASENLLELDLLYEERQEKLILPTFLAKAFPEMAISNDVQTVAEANGCGNKTGKDSNRSQKGSGTVSPATSNQRSPRKESLMVTEQRISPSAHQFMGMSKPELHPLIHGLQNRAGDNHCFLNVVIQALWNLASFRKRMLLNEEHIHSPSLESPECQRAELSLLPPFNKLNRDKTAENKGWLYKTLVETNEQESLVFKQSGMYETENSFYSNEFEAPLHNDTLKTQSQTYEGLSTVSMNSSESEQLKPINCFGNTRPFVAPSIPPVFYTSSAPATLPLLSTCRSYLTSVASRDDSSRDAETLNFYHPQLSGRLASPEASKCPKATRFPLRKTISISSESRISDFSDVLISKDESCVHCALKTLFAQFAFGNVSVLSPDSVRAALTQSFRHTSRFKLGRMEDAEETLEAVLEAFHHSYCKSMGFSLDSRISDGNDVICNPPCLAHQSPFLSYLSHGLSNVPSLTVFGMEFVETTYCENCGDLAEPCINNCYVYRIYIADLMDALSREHPAFKKRKKGATIKSEYTEASDYRKLQYPSLDNLICAVWKAENGFSKNSRSPKQRSEVLDNINLWQFNATSRDAFNGGTTNKSAAQELHEESCICGEKEARTRERQCIKVPRVFACSLIWPSLTATKEDIGKVLSLIAATFGFSRAFSLLSTTPPLSEKSRLQQRALMKESKSSLAPLQVEKKLGFILRGFVGYSSKHYIAFFHDWISMKWIKYDDARIDEFLDWGEFEDFASSIDHKMEYYLNNSEWCHTTQNNNTMTIISGPISVAHQSHVLNKEKSPFSLHNVTEEASQNDPEQNFSKSNLDTFFKKIETYRKDVEFHQSRFLNRHFSL